MKILLVNAKPQVADALATYSGVDVAGLWPRKHDFGNQLEAGDSRRLWYDGGAKLSPRAAWQIREVISRYRPHVVHAFYGRALAHVNLATTGMPARPAIVSFRGITSRLSPLNAGDWISYRHPHVDAHACESNAVRQSLIDSGIAADRCWTTYNTMFSPPNSRPGRAALAEFDIPNDAFVVGTVATMRRVKGIDLLLKAAARCSDIQDIYWLLVGSVVDPEIRKLAALDQLAGRVRFVGARPDASELISAADLFVMPSRAEALCQALLEAMHQGVCPIVSDAGGMKEAVRHNRDGVVVPTENVDALVEAICRLYTERELIARFGRSAQARIADEFTAEKMAERTLAIYRWAIGAESSRSDEPGALSGDRSGLQHPLTIARKLLLDR